MAEGGAELTETGAIHPGLAEAFDVLARTPQERLTSLSVSLGLTCEERLVHAMCLILLKRLDEARELLETERDSSLGSHMCRLVKDHADQLSARHMAGISLLGSDVKVLVDIARIFEVLVEEQLCDGSLIDKAYGNVLNTSRRADSDSADLRDVLQKAGQDFSVFRSSAEPSSLSCRTPLEMSTTNSSQPTSLKSESVCSSRDLEISSPTIPDPRSLPFNQTSERSSKPTLNPTQTSEPSDTFTPSQETRGTSQLVTSKNTPAWDCSSSPCDDLKPEAQAAHRKSTWSDSEDTFYAFVILHEDRDADEAQRLKGLLEGITSGVGSVFGEHFAEAGKSLLRCYEDAINNSAFVLLLLTRNFNTSLSAATTDSAIINSLEKTHKMNCVIPLLPRNNRLSRNSLPMVLKTKVPLDESSRTFESSALRAMSPQKVEQQKLQWSRERLRRKAEMFGDEDADQKMFHEASIATPRCIHIANAHNVQIGAGTTMNVELNADNS